VLFKKKKFLGFIKKMDPGGLKKGGGVQNPENRYMLNEFVTQFMGESDFYKRK
jgi:hypothetical protein